jgi:hypothetical protein
MAPSGGGARSTNTIVGGSDGVDLPHARRSPSRQQWHRDDQRQDGKGFLSDSRLMGWKWLRATDSEDINGLGIHDLFPWAAKHTWH